MIFSSIMKKIQKKIDWKQTTWGFIFLNCVAAMAFVAVLLLVTIFCLRHYTQHGEEIIVPDVTGLYLEEAQVIVAAEGLQLTVIDSTYSNKTPLGTLVEQNPQAGSKAKNGRTIYAIQNARFRRPVILPELRDISLRQAETTIKALGLSIANITYEPSAYKNIILDIRQDDTPLAAGTRMEEGDAVTLIVGKGQGTQKVTVPSVIGKSLTDARSWLLGNMLSTGVIEYDIEPTEETLEQYVVYSQTPESGTIVVEGTNIHLKLSTDIEKTITADNEMDEEDFF